MCCEKKKIFLAVGGLLAVCLFLEIGLRIYFHSFFKKVHLPFVESDIPGVPYLQDLGKGCSIEKNRPRILVVGDYISRHQSGEQRQTYADVLDKKLQSSYELVNVSAAFYSLPEEVRLLRNKMPAYRPDIVVWGYVFNDIHTRNARHVSSFLRLKKSLYEAKVVFPLAVECLFRRAFQKHIDWYYRHNEARILKWLDRKYKSTESRALLFANMAELSRIQKEDSVQIIFVIIPVFLDFSSLELTRINETVYKGCRDAGLTCVDMLPVFKRHGLRAVKEADGDIWHQNAFGNELIAAEVYKQIALKRVQ